jgi:hypothetical protein
MVFICKDSLRVGRFCSAPALPALAPRGRIGSALSFEGSFLNHWENNCLAPAGLWGYGQSFCIYVCMVWRKDCG